MIAAEPNTTGQYQPYPEYKDSGVAWLGDIPKDWRLVTLKYECVFTGGGTPAKDNLMYWGGDIPWVSPKDMKSQFISDSIDKITSIAVTASSTKLVSEGSLLMVVRSGILQRTIPVAINTVPVALNQDMKALRFTSKDKARFFFYYIRGLESQLLQEWCKQGATVESIEHELLANSQYPQPSDKELEVINRYLDFETARIDRLIAQQLRLIELLKEKRQAVISHAVTKGLNPDAPMKESGVEWLGQVPEHWIVAGFKKYIEPIVDYRGKTPTKTESGVFLVTARNIKNGSIDYSLSEEFISEDDYEEVMRRGKPKLGDVLFTTEAPLGEVAQVDNETIALAQRIIKFRGLRDILDCSYLKLFIQSTAFQHGLMTFATGSTALGIKSDRLGYLTQLIPPISEQTQIVEVVAKHSVRFDKLIDTANKAIQLMQERRTALISAAVTGKIDLRGWTPPTAEEAA